MAKDGLFISEAKPTGGGGGGERGLEGGVVLLGDVVDQHGGIGIAGAGGVVESGPDKEDCLVVVLPRHGEQRVEVAAMAAIAEAGVPVVSQDSWLAVELDPCFAFGCAGRDVGFSCVHCFVGLCFAVCYDGVENCSVEKDARSGVATSSALESRRVPSLSRASQTEPVHSRVESPDTPRSL